jgi:hypothetical protein
MGTTSKKTAADAVEGAEQLRHPKEIAADLATLHSQANLSFVPMNIKDALELLVEFTTSVAATYE